MTEQPLDVRTTMKGLSRRRLLLGAVAAAGLCAGIGYGVIRPQVPRAATLVLLPPSPVSGTGVPERDLKTQIVVATSNPVLAPAGHAVSPTLSAADLRRQVSVKALSQQVLQVEVARPRSSDAVALANAVASNYVHYVTQVLPGRATGGPVQILQPATNALPASKLRFPILGGIGLAAGLLVGLILAVVLSNRDRRLRSRDEISRAIGVPVLASIEAEPCKTVSEWHRLLEGSVPSPVVSWSLRRVLHRLAPVDAEATQEIRVVAFRNDRAALAAGPQLATVAATLGIATALVPGDDDVMDPLRAAWAAHRGSGHRPELHAFDSPSSKVDPAKPPVALSSSSGSGAGGHQVAITSGRTRPPSGPPSEREDSKLRSEHPELTTGVSPSSGPGAGGHQVAITSGRTRPRSGPPSEREDSKLKSEHPELTTGVSPSSGLAAPGHQVAMTSGRTRPRGGLPSEREDAKLRLEHPALTISLLVVDRSSPEVRPFGGANVLSVSAGFATADDLARLALAAADAAQAVDGILVVNPEPNDVTTGSISGGEVQQKLITRINRPSGTDHAAWRSR